MGGGGTGAGRTASVADVTIQMRDSGRGKSLERIFKGRVYYAWGTLTGKL